MQNPNAVRKTLFLINNYYTSKTELDLTLLIGFSTCFFYTITEEALNMVHSFY